jgi:hypothetical protein
MLARVPGTNEISVPAALDHFLSCASKNKATPLLVDLFQTVRQLPHHSSGDRSIAGILASGRGSCSSKHILLAALLNRIDIRADVELVQGDFATPLRSARNIPPVLSAAAQQGVPDIHNVVRAWIDGVPVVLDATWHDAVKPYGFRVNDSWNGAGDTEIAVDVTEFLGPATDPAAAKAAMLARWPHEVQQRRRSFLELVNEWVASLPASVPVIS